MDISSIKLKHISGLAILTLFISILLFNLDHLSCNSIKTKSLDEFGTFYGGVLGTTATIFGLFLIFKTYDIQAKQYDILKKDTDFNIINKHYDNLLQEINSLEFRKKNEEKVYRGLDALFNYESDNPNAVLNHLESILISFEHLILMAKETVKYKYTIQKNITLTRIYFLYYEKIIWPVYERIYRTEKQILTKQNHPGFKELIEKYEELTIESYRFLLKEKYVGSPSETEIIQLLKRE